jgi:hypothetical protein
MLNKEPHADLGSSHLDKEMLEGLKGNDWLAELTTFLGETAAAIDGRIR